MEGRKGDTGMYPPPHMTCMYPPPLLTWKEERAAQDRENDMRQHAIMRMYPPPHMTSDSMYPPPHMT